MSAQHPIIAVTGSSGAGTTTVQRAFAEIFSRNGIRGAFVEGDGFFRLTRAEMREVNRGRDDHEPQISHFGPKANHFELLEELFSSYARTGRGRHRRYLHERADAARQGQPAGTFGPWEEIPDGTDVLFYEGLHGAVAAGSWTRRRENRPVEVDRRGPGGGVNAARWADLLIGVAPAVNLEWIQKIHRDCGRADDCEPAEVVNTILRRMPDYIHFIVPQFGLTDVNFQRVPLVDTSNPFIARDVPTPDESMLVIHLARPQRFDIPALLEQFDHAFLSRPDTLVVPGGKLDYALEVVCAPLVLDMLAARPVPPDAA